MGLLGAYARDLSLSLALVISLLEAPESTEPQKYQ